MRLFLGPTFKLSTLRCLSGLLNYLTHLALPSPCTLNPQFSLYSSFLIRMWLLSTDRAELHYFASREQIKDGYAILSHVWNTDGPEQTFEDTKQLAIALKGSSECPRDRATAKVRECCVLAEKHGFRWLWIDTCCIDKTSSAELSETINSMFRYYQLARVCYVYLYDVVVHQPPATLRPGSASAPHDPSSLVGDVDFYTKVLYEPNSAFRLSKWHGRGWTLQELLASEFVAFFSRGWQLLGSKTDLSSLLQEITGIPRPVLTLDTPLSAVSVSERMGWAARRETTRAEDEAYCLLGIFDINMPLLYGEGGPKAFLRLQEEIMKQSRDTTLFSWMCTRQWSLSLSSTLSSLSQEPGPWIGQHTHNADDIAMYLFARSPKDFYSLSYLSMRFDLSHFEEVPHPVTEPMVSPGSNRRPADFPTFSITPYGVLAHIPVIELQGARVLIALLGWTSSAGKRYGLLLTRCPNSSESSYRLYDVGIRGQRLVEIEIDHRQELSVPGLYTFPSKRLPTPNWVDVYLLQKPPQDNISGTVGTGTTSLPLAVLTAGLTSPFRFMQHNLESLRGSKGSDDSLIRLHSISCEDLAVPWTGLGPPMTFTFGIVKHGVLDTQGHSQVRHAFCLPEGSEDSKNWRAHNFQAEEVVLQIGRCSTTSLPSARSHGPGPHWAKMHLLPVNSADISIIAGSPSHDCSVDHVCEWPNSRKETVIVLPQPVGIYEFCLMKLSFVPCPISATSLIGDIAILPFYVLPRPIISGPPQEAAEERRRMLRRRLPVFADETVGKDTSAFDVIPKEYWPDTPRPNPEPEPPTPVNTSWTRMEYHQYSWIQHEFEDPDWMTSSFHNESST